MLYVEKLFWILGSIINPAYDLLLSSAGERFGTKRYMQCVALLVQAWGIFFSTYTYSNYLYRPCVVRSAYERTGEYFDQLSSQLYSAIRRAAFSSLRNILVNTMLPSACILKRCGRAKQLLTVGYTCHVPATCPQSAALKLVTPQSE
jgi:hypothetical protein